ncbi:MAG: exo-alpha-sialidase [Planctomycetes bacterium]|nr:exo-alpha-sialidase [Planctomycetota bacterium]
MFTSGAEGYHTYRIPALVVSTRGTLLAICEGRKNNHNDWGEINIVLKRSFDNGTTWQRMQIVAAEEGDITIGNPAPVVDTDTGKVWLAFCRNNDQVYVTNSADDGATWSTPENITRDVKLPAWTWYATGPGHGIQLKTGRLLIPCWADGTQKIGEIQFSFCIYSDDHGATWKRGRALTRNASDECDIVELNDGSIYLNARSRKGKRQRAWALSRDRGHSWSEVRYDAAQPEPSCDGAVLRLTDTRLFKKNRVLVSCPANPRSRDHLTVRMSYDECRSWSVSKLVDAGYSGYSDLAATTDKTILCLYETNSVRDITLVRFNVEWLTDEQDSLNPR